MPDVQQFEIGVWADAEIVKADPPPEPEPDEADEAENTEEPS